ncbi:unnamed protein product [Didymodactylos carnosus]|uniref:F5/8 type C domain-containing protein n=1 Tax=Didymodactylos carnosus TaxID=1234261 RepID=A0A813TF62_9BILA|nr:unnamed protein product [Didymodactylos carnosus]CAF1069336.1 unnamed protein product [Didymodactylos carnosus]CAF3598900.1 unnamed protein product [Didymodactylos carnosus]CAF3833881.1 unnamed protein product [Didymodactylos carnosus]
MYNSCSVSPHIERLQIIRKVHSSYIMLKLYLIITLIIFEIINNQVAGQVTNTCINSDIKSRKILLNGKQSTVYCSSCLPYRSRSKLRYKSSTCRRWCSQKAFLRQEETEEYVQLELPTPAILGAIFVQGQKYLTYGKKYSGIYTIEYRRTKDGPWLGYGQRRNRKMFVEKKVLNFNRLSNKTGLTPFIVASEIRIILSRKNPPPCLKIELYGCRYDGGLISYRMAQSVQRDYIYDGIISNTSLRGGLGMLTDNDPLKYLQWPRNASTNSQIFLFAFNCIRRFQSTEIVLRCINDDNVNVDSSSLFCSYKLNIGFFDSSKIVRYRKNEQIWSNVYTMNINEHDETTLLLSLNDKIGQFIIIQITVDVHHSLLLSDIKFNSHNDVLLQCTPPSYAFIEGHLHKLEQIVDYFIKYSQFQRKKTMSAHSFM